MPRVPAPVTRTRYPATSHRMQGHCTRLGQRGAGQIGVLEPADHLTAIHDPAFGQPAVGMWTVGAAQTAHRPAAVVAVAPARSARAAWPGRVHGHGHIDRQMVDPGTGGQHTFEISWPRIIGSTRTERPAQP